MTAVGIPLDRRVGAQAPPRRSRYRPTRPILFVVPAFNEVDNLPRLFADLEAHRRLLPAGSRVIIVDDGSEDGTDLLVENYGGPLPVELVRLPREPGPGRSVPRRLRRGSRRLQAVEHDRHARGRHDERSRPAPGDARACGRRRRPCARVRPRRRARWSTSASCAASSAGVPAPSCASRSAWTRAPSRPSIASTAPALLRDAQARYGDKLIEEPGFACKAELLAKLSSLGARIEEVPVSVDASRRVGKSKMRIGPTIRGYWRLARRSEDRDAVVV